MSFPKLLPFPATAGGLYPNDYRLPKPDETRTKIRITRACWVRLSDGTPVTAPANSTLILPFWQCQQIIDAGRGELV